MDNISSLFVPDFPATYGRNRCSSSRVGSRQESRFPLKRFTLQRRKQKPPIPIFLQNEVDCPIAKSTDSVEKEDRLFLRCQTRTVVDSRLRRLLISSHASAKPCGASITRV